MLLNSSITDSFRIKDYQKSALLKLDIKNLKDLLWHFPFRYEKFGEPTTIADAKPGETATFYGQIIDIDFEKTWKKKMNICKAKFSDGTGVISLVWFHQPFIARILNKNDYLAATGKVQENKNGIYLANPVYEKVTSFEASEKTHNMIAVYPETRGISSRWFRFAIQKVLKELLKSKEEITDFIPKEILNHYKLPSLKNALIYIHSPKEKKDADAARKRFAFEEIFLIQLSRLQKKADRKKQSSFKIETDEKDLKEFLTGFPFKLTDGQNRAIEHILKDFKKDSPMARLLEGDVGSGKTVIAATAARAAVKNDYQIAYMAPTEVLARQLFSSFIKYFIGSGTKIGLITSAECLKFPSKVKPSEQTHISKNQLLKWLASGEINIVIGTHSLIQKSVKFSTKKYASSAGRNLALVIIDEQHRFGTNQRCGLVNKNSPERSPLPHLLSMTATPIPRTLALTIYGDLDLTVLDEMPPGRKEIVTEIVPPSERSVAYEKIREEIKKGRQVYIICPRIEPPDKKRETLLTLNMRAVKEEAERVSREVFPEYKIGVLHGKMTPKEKEKTMNDFRGEKINILVATSVIEVGIDVPNATVIIIEGAERFGLAQLHQLRGRVRRSGHQSYCFVFTESKSLKTTQRLKALKTAKNGFELAEYDLQFRGAGELSGKKQWGISDVGMEALKNIKMVEAARTEAQNLLKEDPELKNHPLIAEKISEENFNIHFE